MEMMDLNIINVCFGYRKTHGDNTLKSEHITKHWRRTGVNSFKDTGKAFSFNEFRTQVTGMTLTSSKI